MPREIQQVRATNKADECAVDGCPYTRVPNEANCPRHAGLKTKERKYNLRLLQLQYQSFAEDPTIKSLRDELALARLLLAQIWRKCEIEAVVEGEMPKVLYMHSDSINKQIHLIKNLAETCQRLEQKTQLFLDYQQVIGLAGKFVHILEDAAITPDLRNEIIVEIETAILDMAKEHESSTSLLEAT